jgi:hypothetical protein
MTGSAAAVLEFEMTLNPKAMCTDPLLPEIMNRSWTIHRPSTDVRVRLALAIPVAVKLQSIVSTIPTVVALRNTT